MTREEIAKIEAANDVLWTHYGNGEGTEWKILMAELEKLLWVVNNNLANRF